jgi:hypothetical protein
MLHEIDEVSKRRYVSPYDRAVIHAGLGEKDNAIGWLDQAFLVSCLR